MYSPKLLSSLVANYTRQLSSEILTAWNFGNHLANNFQFKKAFQLKNAPQQSYI